MSIFNLLFNAAITTQLANQMRVRETNRLTSQSQLQPTKSIQSKSVNAATLLALLLHRPHFHWHSSTGVVLYPRPKPQCLYQIVSRHCWRTTVLNSDATQVMSVLGYRPTRRLSRLSVRQ